MSSKIKFIRLSLIFLAVLLPSTAPILFAQTDVTAKLEYGNQTFVGKPLGWDGKRFALLDRAGGLNLIPANSPDQLQVAAETFEPYSPDQIVARLTKEFGDRYYISKTERFVVVHPWGPSSVFAPPFESFHNRFVDFFEANGIELKSPDFPQVAIVLRSRNDFNRYLINEIDVRDSRIGGYYSRLSNRITTFDPQGLIRRKGDPWMYSAGPIIHEATHQSAFNTGLHNRFSPPPKWVSEGVATLFEARGFNDASAYKELRDRVNPVRLKALRKRMERGALRDPLLNLIARDNLFGSDIELAYALSWGLSFYLYETQPEKYFAFLKKDAQRKNFKVNSPNQRVSEFALAFGNDFDKLTEELTAYFKPKSDRRIRRNQ